MWRPCIVAVWMLACKNVEAVRPEREFVKGRRNDDGPIVIDKAELQRISDALKNGDLETAAASKIQIGSGTQADGEKQISESGEKEAENAEILARDPTGDESKTESPAKDSPAPGKPEDKAKESSKESKEHQAQLHVSFEELSKSHNDMDRVMKQYKEVADKGEQRAAKFVDVMGTYQTSLTGLREPLRRISSQVTELQSKIVTKLEADEKERMEPLNSLQDELGPSGNESSVPATTAES
ncbi:NUAK2 [Symbiodinium sp. CCMP2592]|nr:NUAK2 [Symbiodinium sp. CCMP2592]